MAYRFLNIAKFYGGIADSLEFGPPGSFAAGTRNLNIYADPGNIELNLASELDSGTTVIGLVKWIVSGSPYLNEPFAYDADGRIYQRIAGVWTIIRTVASSHGQGFGVHGDYLYYVWDTGVGRYGPLTGAAVFDDNWQTGLNDTSTSGFAPFFTFKEGFAVGNGNDLAWWDGSVWVQDKVVLPQGYNIRALTSVDEFIAIGAWVGDSITDVEAGLVFYWDALSTTFNYFQDFQNGSVNALFNSRNRLVSFLGSGGYMYLNYRPFQKVQTFPGVPDTGYVDVYPGAVSFWKGMTLIGIAASTNISTFQQGVYQWGSKSDRLPEVLNFGFTLSTGAYTGTTLAIGAVAGMGDEFYIGWGSNGTYGIDRVASDNDRFVSGVYQSLYFDDNRAGFPKRAMVMKALHSPLLSGQSVTLGYRRDQDVPFVTDTANTTVGSTETRFVIPDLQNLYKKIQLQVEIGGTGVTTPTVHYLGFEYDDLRKDVGAF